MGCYIIKGGNRLSGEVNISGSKNAVLPILAGATVQKETTITNIPFLSDVANTLEIMNKLGVKIKSEGNTITTSSNIISTEIDKELNSKMRSSILFLGALLGKYGECTIYQPGGCQLGNRPINLHIWAMEQMGANICYDNDKIICKGKLKGTELTLPIPSVGVTENIILASINAKGTTIINNCAKEPEIDDLIKYLNSCGHNIKKEKNVITIEESSNEKYNNHKIMGDRIEAGTFMAMAAITSGELFIKNIDPNNMWNIISIFKKIGCIIKTENNSIYIDAPEKLYSIPQIITKPYSGFPTDMQPQMTALLSIANGTSRIKETLFSARNKHIPELNKMGANITMLNDSFFEIKGVNKLIGNEVFAKDLRGGAGLIIAGLGAEGESKVWGSEYVERGYEGICSKIELIGGEIERENREWIISNK